MDMNHDKQHSVHTHHVQFVVSPPAARGFRGAKQGGLTTKAHDVRLSSNESPGPLAEGGPVGLIGSPSQGFSGPPPS